VTRNDCPNQWCKALLIMLGHGSVKFWHTTGVYHCDWDTTSGTISGSGPDIASALEALTDRWEEISRIDAGD
jgi:hypothetical protein